jgi:tRNA threonylcarbamoyladenosine biosynthesis protein TsaE
MAEREARLNEAELEAWGERIGREVEAPVVLALWGDLGAGKSTLARAVARGAGVEGPVPSPTFNLLFEYQAPRGVRIVHLDLYRLEQQDDVWELGWAELGDGPEIVLIVWPEHAEMILPRERWDVELEEERSDPSRRVVRVRAVGSPPALPPLPTPEPVFP